MKRWTIFGASVATLAVAAYVATAQQPGGEGRKPDDPPAERERPARDGRKEGRAAQRAPAKSGVVSEFHKNPDGDTAGLRLDDGTEVRFPPSAGRKVTSTVALKDRVTIEGWTHPGESEIHAATIKNEASGKLVAVDRLPPKISQSGERGREGGPEDGADERKPPRGPEEGGLGPRTKPKPKRPGSSPGPAVETAHSRPANPAPTGAKPTPNQRAEPGSIAGFVRIPAGEFAMGDHHGFVDPKHGGDETPIHTVRLDSFCIGINDVTTKEYCALLNSVLAQKSIEVRDGGVYLAGGRELLAETRGMSPYSRLGWEGKTFTVLDKKESHPIVCIRWEGAAVYCNWLSAQQHLPQCYDTSTWGCDFNKSGYRLPTEAEWEYAARGGQTDPYWNFPWANEADPAKANWPESKNPYRTGPLPWTTPVGFFSGKLHRKTDFGWPGAQETFQTSDGANGYGLYDMAGNVWQFINDWYDRDHYACSPAENPPGPERGSPLQDGKPYRGMRGGNWYNGEHGHSRVSNRNPSYYRGPQDPDHPYYHLGFRVVLPIDAESRRVIKPAPVVRVARAAAGSGRQPPRDAERPGRTPPRGDERRGGKEREADDDPPPRDDQPARRRPDQNGETATAGAAAKPRSGFVLYSPAAAEGGMLPKEFTGDGSGATLPLEWSGAPSGTRSFALIMHHVAPDEIKWYWVLYNISADVTRLPKNVEGIGTLGNNSMNRDRGYAPPRSKGPGPKKYTLTLYALSAAPQITVPSAEVSRDVLLAVMKNSILATAELNVIYSRGEQSAEGEAPRVSPRPGEPAEILARTGVG